MKRLLTPLAILVLLGLLLPGLPTLARAGKVPHEDPARAADQFDRAGLILSYSKIAGQASDSQYQSAREALQELEKADIPDDFRDIIDQYNALNSRLFTTLDNLEMLLGDTTDLLAQNRVDEARRYLESSQGTMQDAEYLLEDTAAAIQGLREKLSMPGISPTDRLSLAFSDLEASQSRLADLVEKYKSIHQDLDERYARLTGLTPTIISLRVTPDSAYVGDNVTATGTLTSADGPLVGKTVVINSDNMPVGTAITGTDGFYAASVTVPFVYRDTQVFTASYEPSGEDSAVFQAGRSQPVNINARFSPTRLEVDIPDSVYCGLRFILSGEISTEDKIITRCVYVSLDDRPLAEARVSGRFSFEVTPPPDALSGRRKLIIEVAPEGRYAGAVKKKAINLASAVLRIEARTPSIVLLPASVRVSGTVSTVTGPLADTPVTLTLMSSSTTVRTAPDGSFSCSIKLHALPQEAPLAKNPFRVATTSKNTPHDLSPVGSHSLQITAALPGYTVMKSTVQRPLVTINPLSAGLLLVLLSVPGLVYYRKKRTRAVSELEKASLQATDPAVKTADAAPLPVPVIDFTGVKGRVLSAYRSGLAAAEKITGLIMAPSLTLREFQARARFPSPVTAARFAELTAIAESSLYASGDPPEAIAAQAERLVAIIAEELRLGNP